MRTTPTIYQYTGLLAGLGLAAIIAGLILLVVLPELEIAAWIILGLGACLLAAAFIIDFRKVSGAVTGKRGRFSTGTTVMVSVFIGITLLVNAVSIGNFKRFDTTGLSQFTLTTQTKDALAEMDMDVEAICFFVPGDPFGIGVDFTTFVSILLEEYQAYTDHLSFQIIDPDEHPDEARKYGITQYQSVVFESELGGRLVFPDEILQQAEHSFTSAILEVTGVAQKTVYFLTGHGESDINGEYAYARQGLLDNLYNVRELDLMVFGGIPADCAVLIISAPQRPLTTIELEIIQDYLEQDGWLIVLVNPDPPEGIVQLLSSWYIDIKDGTLIDPAAYVSPNLDNPLISRTRNEFGFSEMYFPGATAIDPQAEIPDDVFLMPLFYTSDNSWLETDFNPMEEPEFNEGIEEKGSRAIGVLITFIPPEEDEEGAAAEETKNTRLIIVGDSDFATNQHFYNADNGNLFINLVEFLTVGKQLISIERKVLPYRRLIIEPEEQTIIQVTSIGLLPALVLIAGAIIWWRRR